MWTIEQRKSVILTLKILFLWGLIVAISSLVSYWATLFSLLILPFLVIGLIGLWYILRDKL